MIRRGIRGEVVCVGYVTFIRRRIMRGQDRLDG